MTGSIFLLSNCLVALMMGMLIFIMVAYYSLPVRSPSEGWRVARRMLSGITGRGKPVAFIKEGQLVHSEDNKKNSTPKIALVDLTSAVVLGAPQAALRVVRSRRNKPVGNAENGPRSRVAGSGLVFVDPGESIRGITSLRTHVRLAPGIQCRTNDGIEFTATLSVIFSLIQPPALLQVGYVGKRPEDLRVLTIDTQTGTLRSVSDELDDQDKNQVYVFARSRQTESLPSTDLVGESGFKEYPPYHLNESAKQRIASVVYYHPLNIHDHTRDDWTDLPLEEAIRLFRNMIARVSYDDLFTPDADQKLPLVNHFKPHFFKAVRNQGLLAYQLVRRVDSAPLEIGQKIDPVTCRLFPVQEFATRTILREHGIRILRAGFSELDPGEVIRRQRLENWQARWQRKVEIERANQDLAMMRIRNRARADAQRAMVFELSQILKSTPHSEEALTVRIFQALESAATDPATRQLLPHDAIVLLRSLRQWLVPEEVPPADFIE
jgi:hypothetical protein